MPIISRRRRRGASSGGGASVADHLAYTTQPVGSTTPNLATQPVVAAKKADGSTDTTFAGTVALTLNVLTGSATLGGTTSVALSSGVATFTNVTVTSAAGATWTLTASLAGLASATSSTGTTTAAGGTTFTNAIRFASSGQSAAAAHHASYDDLAQLTVALLVRWDGASLSGMFASKVDAGNTAGWKMNGASTTLLDMSGHNATTDDFKRDAGITADNSWQWLFIGYDRSAHTSTRAVGPQAGTIAYIHNNVAAGGAGALVSDVAAPFSLGTANSGDASASVVEVRFCGIASGVLSLANMQAIASDALAQAALFIDYWKPSSTGGPGTSIPSGKSVLPALVTSGATVV